MPGGRAAHRRRWDNLPPGAKRQYQRFIERGLLGVKRPATSDKDLAAAAARGYYARTMIGKDTMHDRTLAADGRPPSTPIALSRCDRAGDHRPKASPCRIGRGAISARKTPPPGKSAASPEALRAIPPGSQAPLGQR
jgi:hypothetical protein